MRRVTVTLGIRRRVEGDVDIYGNPVVTYTDSEPWPVYAVAPRVSDEPTSDDNRDAIFTGLTVYAPVDGPAPGPLDLVTVGGEAWQVAGRVGVWDTNPHVTRTKQRGIVVNLDRTEG